MTWKDVLPRGEKGRLIQRVRNATDDLPQDIIDGAMFYIGGNIGWRTVAGKVRDLVDFLSNERNGSGDLRYTLDGREMGHAHNCSHSKCIVFRRVKKFTNWGHHACNDRSFPHTDITGENQNRMVDALIDILSWCGAFNSYDDSDTDDSNGE